MQTKCQFRQSSCKKAGKLTVIWASEGHVVLQSLNQASFLLLNWVDLIDVDQLCALNAPTPPTVMAGNWWNLFCGSFCDERAMIEIHFLSHKFKNNTWMEHPSIQEKSIKNENSDTSLLQHCGANGLPRFEFSFKCENQWLMHCAMFLQMMLHSHSLWHNHFFHEMIVVAWCTESIVPLSCLIFCCHTGFARLVALPQPVRHPVDWIWLEELTFIIDCNITGQRQLQPALVLKFKCMHVLFRRGTKSKMMRHLRISFIGCALLTMLLHETMSSLFLSTCFLCCLVWLLITEDSWMTVWVILKCFANSWMGQISLHGYRGVHWQFIIHQWINRTMGVPFIWKTSNQPKTWNKWKFENACCLAGWKQGSCHQCSQCVGCWKWFHLLGQCTTSWCVILFIHSAVWLQHMFCLIWCQCTTEIIVCMWFFILLLSINWLLAADWWINQFFGPTKFSIAVTNREIHTAAKWWKAITGTQQSNLTSVLSAWRRNKMEAIERMSSSLSVASDANWRMSSLRSKEWIEEETHISLSQMVWPIVTVCHLPLPVNHEQVLLLLHTSHTSAWCNEGLIKNSIFDIADEKDKQQKSKMKISIGDAAMGSGAATIPIIASNSQMTTKKLSLCDVARVLKKDAKKQMSSWHCVHAERCHWNQFLIYHNALFDCQTRIWKDLTQRRVCITCFIHIWWTKFRGFAHWKSWS